MKKTLSFIMIMSMLLGMIAMTSFGQTTADVDTSNNLYAYSKTATELYEDLYTDVTLTVGGNEDGLGVDIIYVLGSFLSMDQVRSNVMISCLIDTFRDIVKNGIPVNFGVVPFSSTNDPVLPLTKLETQEDIDALPELLAGAIEKAGKVYDGVNMENAIITADRMFSTSPLAGKTDRQHLVMIASGHTYFFNSGENNENISAVPVRFTKGDVDTNELFYMEKAWMRARNNSTNSYPVPMAFVNEYKANPDKYDSLWDCYWTYIDMWAKADIAAGDKVVYNATTRTAADFISWFNSGKYSSATGSNGKGGTFTYSGYGAVISNPDASVIENMIKFDLDDAGTEFGPNPFEFDYAAHAIGNERAMWEAYNYIKENITGKGIRFYPIYNPLREDGSATNGSNKYYSWTDQYIGHSFMNMLAGGKAITYSSTDNKAFFDPIKAEIISYLSIGTTVEDYIGFSDDATEGYNFEFIDEINGEAKLPVLKVGNKTYVTTKLETAVEGATFSYVFAAEEGAEPTFTMDYYYGNGTTEEKFIWTFNENVTKHANVSLTYTLELAQRSTVVGEHVAHTNISAVLHPIDSNKVEGADEYFERPFVKYVVLPETISVSVVKLWEDEDNAEGLRPDSIIVNLYADGELVATQEITANDEWKFVFENLAKFDGEEVIEYTLTENEVDEYYTEITGNYIEGFVITNILEEDIPDNPPPLDPPKTGDATVLFVILGLAAVVAGSTLVIRTRKEI